MGEPSRLLDTRLASAIACTAALASAGCSLIFVSRAPSDAEALPATQELDCTTSDAAPIVDSILTGLEVARTVYAFAAKDSTYQKFPISRGADIGFGVGFTALFAGSAIYGYSSTARCATAKARRERILEERNSRPPAAPAAPTAPVFSTTVPPAEVAGFSFGASKDAARAACESASHEWKESRRAFECSGTPVDSGLDARARLTFCGDTACRIELLMTPKGADATGWVDRLTTILDDLRARYGEPTSHDVSYADSSCAGSRLFECIQSGSTHFRYEWKWANGKYVVLSLGARPSRVPRTSSDPLAAATIHVRYGDGRKPAPEERAPPATTEAAEPAAPVAAPSTTVP